jgi:mono/diheme cytochrome c family protein
MMKRMLAGVGGARERVFTVLLLSLLASQVEADGAAPVDFNRTVRPILSNNCFKCHGPDAAERQSGLRLDVVESATRPAESGRLPIVAGRPDQSELVRRITASDPDQRMPPPDSGKSLSDEERRVLSAWIEQGAKYDTHWAFVAPRRPQLPEIPNDRWGINAVDRFVLARLQAAGLVPSSPADPATLVRRLYLDLLGLPPTPAQAEEFLRDDSPHAYERLVDRLLDNPHFGERMALDWLDAARFADTHGYHIDSGRDMTRWREWVIDAFNRNLPFDQFIVDQLAGDLIPNPSLAQRVASGFHRNHMINFEGGAIPQEYHTAYIVDRVNTTGTVFLGLTVGCSQCHDHKYDPLTQKEYYQLFAFFHNVPENGLDGSKGNAAPLVKVPSPAQQAEIDSFNARIAAVDRGMTEDHADRDREQSEWEKEATRTQPEWTGLPDAIVKSVSGASIRFDLQDRSWVVEGENAAKDTYEIRSRLPVSRVTGVRVEFLADKNLKNQGPGRSENGNLVLTTFAVKASIGGKPPQMRRLAAASASFSQSGFGVEQAIDDQPASGWGIHPETGKPHHAVFVLADPIDGSAEDTLEVRLEFHSPYAQHQAGRFRILVTNAADPRGDSLPASVASALRKEPADRSADELTELRRYFRGNVSAAGMQLKAERELLVKQLQRLESEVPTAMVMQEMEKPRETFLLVRGQYDRPADRVQAAVPAFLPPLPEGAPANRLGLAQWLVHPSHPLTTRVVVNRYWQAFFGTGLVKTAEDFGSQGEPPTHPQLLDWLAVEFRTGESVLGSPWNLKAMVRLLVTSATYRQQSIVTREGLSRDPENRLLARGARIRLPAEFIRDQALAVSGLLDRRIGGASVSPYQPPGIWEELASRADGKNWTAQEYSQSHGRDLYRRTMYTFWKRTAPPPTLVAFDAPDRETCVVRRARTNTPLQALILMNDPTYVEASRKLAERILRESGPGLAQRVRYAFQLVLAREPRPMEIDVIAGIYERQRETASQDQHARELLRVGESPVDETLDPDELAAWALVASVLLNLDETVTRS